MSRSYKTKPYLYIQTQKKKINLQIYNEPAVSANMLLVAVLFKGQAQFKCCL